MPNPRLLVSYYRAPLGGFVSFPGDDHAVKAQALLRLGGRHLLSWDFPEGTTEGEMAKFFDGFHQGYDAMQHESRKLLGLSNDS